ncbi:MAG: hypothetical protein WC878_02445 [Candidatus Paceibacterota bacterium]|jgi:hypothetical protein
MAPNDLHAFMQIIINLLAKSMGLFYAAAIASFFWGVALFVFNAQDDKKRETGKEWMKWAVIALFILVTLWGIMGFLFNSFQLESTIIPPLGST